MTAETRAGARCEICGWPLAASIDEGCIPGNCSYRPESGSDEWYRIQRQREKLAADARGSAV